MAFILPHSHLHIKYNVYEIPYGINCVYTRTMAFVGAKNFRSHFKRTIIRFYFSRFLTFSLRCVRCILNIYTEKIVHSFKSAQNTRRQTEESFSLTLPNVNPTPSLKRHTKEVYPSKFPALIPTRMRSTDLRKKKTKQKHNVMVAD